LKNNSGAIPPTLLIAIEKVRRRKICRGGAESFSEAILATGTYTSLVSTAAVDPIVQLKKTRLRQNV
jgi:hypothetical protein